MKRTIISILIAVALLSSVVFVYLKSVENKINKQTILPRITTDILPDGKVGNFYSADVSAFIPTSKAKLTIEALEIPTGLYIDGCNYLYDGGDIKPNTIINCKIKGTPVVEGNTILLKVSAEGYKNRSSVKYSVNIER